MLDALIRRQQSLLMDLDMSLPNPNSAALPLIEICVEGIDGLVAAQENGADRVELCASLVEGGITPSLGTVRLALEVATSLLYIEAALYDGYFD